MFGRSLGNSRVFFTTPGDGRGSSGCFLQHPEMLGELPGVFYNTRRVTEKLEVVEVGHWKTWSGWSGSIKNLKWLKWVNKKLEVALKNLKWLKWVTENLEVVEVGLCIWSGSLNSFILCQSIDRMKLIHEVVEVGEVGCSGF